MSEDSAYWRTPSAAACTLHFVPDPDNVVFNVRDWDRGIWGNGSSSLVLEMPLALRHERVGECTAQEQHRATQSCSCIAKYCKRQLQIPSSLRTNEKFLGYTGCCCQRKLPLSKANETWRTALCGCKRHTACDSGENCLGIR